MTMLKRSLRSKILALSGALLLLGCEKPSTTIQSGSLILQVNDQLQTRVSSADAKPFVSDFQTSEYLESDKNIIELFSLDSYSSSPVSEKPGNGTAHIFTGSKGGITKTLTVTAYEDFPELLSTKVSYSNKSEKDIEVTAWVNNAYQILSQNDTPPFWAFQGSSSGERADWIKPIEGEYYKQNYMGMNSSDYGGGIPVTDVWRTDAGLMVGHLSLTPELVSLPTELKKYESTISVGVSKTLGKHNYLKPGETLETLETFVGIHSGDYYNGLKKYASLMEAKGMKTAPSQPAAYEPIWCAWGYERNFTLDEVTGTLPKVKELGIKWAVLDDGFQQAEGDWHTNKGKFPKGDIQMKQLVDNIHSYGLKAKLWWAPLAADPGSKLLTENPDMRLYLADWSPQYITWWDAYYLAPTNPKTIGHTKEIVNLFMNDWGFDGLKLDGQHMNAVAPDHNPASEIDDPELAPKLLPQFFKTIYDEALSIKPDAVVENCPCGTCMSYFNMPYMNQSVSSDPTSSWQIRHKRKTYKALVANTAYYGDHVELSDGGDDFASSFGVGAVLGTKFTWPKDNPTAGASYLLTPEREQEWKKWFGLYNEKMISKAQYLGDLYDIGYDKPETHLIQKGDTLFYAFYDESWEGQIELRGLSEAKYAVHDYFNDKSLGEVESTKSTIEVKFEDFLLIEVYPK
ncbi:MAG: glycoside hydrolase family 36 protein [Cyclobacteriaceae bacterium]